MLKGKDFECTYTTDVPFISGDFQRNQKKIELAITPFTLLLSLTKFIKKQIRLKMRSTFQSRTHSFMQDTSTYGDSDKNQDGFVERKYLL